MGLSPVRGLPESLIEDDACSHGQVKAADVRVLHRDGDAAILIILQNFLRQSLRFLTENEKISTPEMYRSIGPLHFFRYEIEFVFVVALQELIDILPIDDIDVRPVIEPGPLKITVIGTEPERFDEMENGIGSAAESCDAAGIMLPVLGGISGSTRTICKPELMTVFFSTSLAPGIRAR